MSKINSLKAFRKELETNPALQQDFKNDPVKAIQNIETKNPLEVDAWVYRIIVSSLGITILLIVVGVITLKLTNKSMDANDIPTILTSMGSAAVGAIAGLLTPPPRSQD